MEYSGSSHAEALSHVYTLLRDIFGKPSRSVNLDPAWLTSDLDFL